MLKRLDLTSRTLLALIEPGAVLPGRSSSSRSRADRSYMLAAAKATSPRGNRRRCQLRRLPMANGLARLASRFLGDPDAICDKALGAASSLDAAAAAGARARDVCARRHRLGRRSADRDRGAGELSPDALTGMEANLRFPGRRRWRRRSSARLSAWQNWIFQRPNAVGERARYGATASPRARVRLPPDVECDSCTPHVLTRERSRIRNST